MGRMPFALVLRYERAMTAMPASRHEGIAGALGFWPLGANNFNIYGDTLMKKSLLALAVFGAFATAAHADSVTVFGSIDAGIEHTSAGGVSNTAFLDGVIEPSTFGFRGSEDLGGGLKAGFTLEGGFGSNNGSAFNEGLTSVGGAATGILFGREAKVTLGGEWGTIGAGLQFDPALIASISTEPRGLADSGSMLSYWINATAFGQLAAGQQIFTGGIFDSNAISYTYAGNGLYFSVLHSFGGVAGNTSANADTSVGASYTNSGFTVSGGYATVNSPVGNTLDTIDFVGVGYATGPWAVRAQYDEFKYLYDVGGNVPAADVKAWGIGVDWKITPSNKLNLSYYSAKDDGAGAGGTTTEVALLDTYSLSKRTSIWAQIVASQADANAGASAGIAGTFGGGANVYAPSPAGLANEHATTFGFGIQTRF